MFKPLSIVMILMMLLSGGVAYAVTPTINDTSLLQPDEEGPGRLGILARDTDEGVMVSNVLIDSPADVAGIQINDIIIAINETDIPDVSALQEFLAETVPGDVVTVTLLRQEETLSVEVALGDVVPMPEIEVNMQPGAGMPYLGIVLVMDMTGNIVIDVVEADSPADEAGLQAEDIILAVNEETFETTGNLVDYILAKSPGDEITLRIERNGEELIITAELGSGPGQMRPVIPPDMPEAPQLPEMPRTDVFQTDDRLQLGVRYRSLTPEIAAQEGLSVEEGALITEVVVGSPADDSGFIPGDIIIAVDDDAIDIEHTLSDRLYAYEAQDRVMFTVVREGEEIEIGAVLASDHPARRQSNAAFPGQPSFTPEMPFSGIPGMQDGVTLMCRSPRLDSGIQIYLPVEAEESQRRIIELMQRSGFSCVPAPMFNPGP